MSTLPNQLNTSTNYLSYYVTSEISTKSGFDRHHLADLRVFTDTSNQTNSHQTKSSHWGAGVSSGMKDPHNLRSNLKSREAVSSYSLSSNSHQSNMVPTQNVSTFTHNQNTFSQANFGSSHVRKIPASRSIPNFQTVSSSGQGGNLQLYPQRSMLVSEQMPPEMSLFSDDHYGQYPKGNAQRKLNFAELKDIMWKKSAHSLIKQIATDSSEQQRRIRTAAVIDRTAPTTIRRHRSQSTGRSDKRSKSIGQITPRPNIYLAAPHENMSSALQQPVSVETVLKYPILRQTMV